MSNKISKELAIHRLEQAKEDLAASEASIFHSIRAILALEPKDFKKHKDVIAYFNKNYVHTEIFPKSIGRKVSDASRIREDSDYDDEFVVRPEDTMAQIQTAKEMIELSEKYINNFNIK